MADHLIIQWRCAHPSEAGVPRYRVCCPECLTSYVLAAWRNQIRRTHRCASCAQLRVQARKRALREARQKATPASQDD